MVCISMRSSTTGLALDQLIVFEVRHRAVACGFKQTAPASPDRVAGVVLYSESVQIPYRVGVMPGWYVSMNPVLGDASVELVCQNQDLTRASRGRMVGRVPDTGHGGLVVRR